MGLNIKILDCSPDMCRSCYERRIKSINSNKNYDINSILQTLKIEIEKIPKEQRQSWKSPCIHGGEPLAIPFQDLERMLAFIYEFYGGTSIQTNAVLITDSHIELFKKYKTRPGVSIDGDIWQLNYGRWNAREMDFEQIQKMTDKTIENIRKLKQAGLSVSIISLLRKYNASQEMLPDFIRFLFRMKDEFLMPDISLLPTTVYENYEDEELSNDELGESLCKLADICFSDPGIRWLPFRDVVDILIGHVGNAKCVYKDCDIWRTSSERAVLGNGVIGCCLRGGAANDGVQVLATNNFSNERSISLLQAPQELNGCQGCKWWFCCHGGCPGSGIDNDWRNRTRFCEAWKILFEHAAKKIKGLFPNIYLMPDFWPQEGQNETILASLSGSSWSHEKRKNISKLKEEIKKMPCKNVEHGDRPHGDHEDHGDHTDQARK